MEIDDRVESDDDEDHDQSEASTIMSNEEYEWDELAPANGWDQLAPIPDIAIEDEENDEIGQPVSLIAETVRIAPEQTPPATNMIIPNKVVNIDPSPMNRLFRALPARPIIQLAPTPKTTTINSVTESSTNHAMTEMTTAMSNLAISELILPTSNKLVAESTGAIISLETPPVPTETAVSSKIKRPQPKTAKTPT